VDWTGLTAEGGRGLHGGTAGRPLRFPSPTASYGRRSARWCPRTGTTRVKSSLSSRRRAPSRRGAARRGRRAGADLLGGLRQRDVRLGVHLAGQGSARTAAPRPPRS